MECRLVHFARDVKLERRRLVGMHWVLAVLPGAPEDLLGKHDDLTSRLHLWLDRRLVRQVDGNRRQAVKVAVFGFHTRRTVLHVEPVEDLLLGGLDPPPFDFFVLQDGQRSFAGASGALGLVALRRPELAALTAHLLRLHS